MVGPPYHITSNNIWHSFWEFIRRRRRWRCSRVETEYPSQEKWRKHVSLKFWQNKLSLFVDDFLARVACFRF